MDTAGTIVDGNQKGTTKMNQGTNYEASSESNVSESESADASEGPSSSSPTSLSTSGSEESYESTPAKQQKSESLPQFTETPAGPSALPAIKVVTKKDSTAAKETELATFYKTLDSLPDDGSGKKSYFLMVNKEDVRFSEGKPKFPEGTCFGTTYSNAADFASFFLWKKCPNVLSVYEVTGGVPWKTKKEMFAFLKCKQACIDGYLNVLSECSNCPTEENCCDSNAWDAFLHGKKSQTRKAAGEDGSNVDGVDSAFVSRPSRKYGKHRCRKECVSHTKKRHHESCPNKCHDGCFDVHFHHNSCIHDKKRFRKARVYFARRKCRTSNSESGEARYKYFLCIRGGAGPSIESKIKESVNSQRLDVESYLALDKLACKTALCNNNRIAYGISHACGLTVKCEFEETIKTTEECEDQKQKYFPLSTAIPSFVQFYNRTVGMASSSSSSSPQSLVSSSMVAASIDNSPPSSEFIDSRWLLSYNEFLNGKESSLVNDGKVGIEIPSENKLVLVPVDQNLGALSFCVPPSVKSLKDIDMRRKEICAIHGSSQEIEEYNVAVKRTNQRTVGNNLNSSSLLSSSSHVERPKTLKILELYELS